MTTTLVLALAAGLAAGCGSDEEKGAPIPAAAAADLQSRLDEVQRRFDFGEGACADIQNDSKPAVDRIISSLPQDVDAELRDAVQQSFDRLFELSDQECAEEPEAETETQTVTEPPPETETVPAPETETVPTETPPTETEEEPPLEPEDPEVPPGQGGEPPGQGGENPGQGGGGGVISPEDEG